MAEAGLGVPREVLESRGRRIQLAVQSKHLGGGLGEFLAEASVVVLEPADPGAEALQLCGGQLAVVDVSAETPGFVRALPVRGAAVARGRAGAPRDRERLTAVGAATGARGTHGGSLRSATDDSQTAETRH
jgi:hypothetical protein